MKVYACGDDGRCLVGRADIPETAGPTLEVPLFGAASIIHETYTIGTVTHLSGDKVVVERALFLAPGQPPELLPSWAPLSS